MVQVVEMVTKFWMVSSEIEDFNHVCELFPLSNQQLTAEWSEFYSTHYTAKLCLSTLIDIVQNTTLIHAEHL